MTPGTLCQTPGHPVVKDEFPSLMQNANTRDIKQYSDLNSSAMYGVNDNINRQDNAEKRVTTRDVFASGSLHESFLFSVPNVNKENTVESTDYVQTDIKQDIAQSTLQSTKTDAPDNNMVLRALIAGKENTLNKSESEQDGLASFQQQQRK